ncbi:hypothetical protein EG328_009510 [Venturia inaequalis]|uniref:Uncharacterized protein n=1 Tax=Venturia inaequalis TaxID=5025 RepID=A0A8H3U9R8_VENIN|nr:hypothetical protein EG328_009510 [Venturia inaequalis]
MSEGYEQHPRATVKRLPNRGKYDYGTVHQIIDDTPVLHVSFPPQGDDPFPFILPMLGCTGDFESSQKPKETASTAPGTRNPPTKAEMTSTSVLRVDIVSASAKVRVGGPSDDRHDLRDPNVVGKIWTGVVPTWTQYGEPVASSYNEVTTVPGYIQSWIKEENEKGKSTAALAIAQAKK